MQPICFQDSAFPDLCASLTNGGMVSGVRILRHQPDRFLLRRQNGQTGLTVEFRKTAEALTALKITGMIDVSPANDWHHWIALSRDLIDGTTSYGSDSLTNDLARAKAFLILERESEHADAFEEKRVLLEQGYSRENRKAFNALWAQMLDDAAFVDQMSSVKPSALGTLQKAHSKEERLKAFDLIAKSMRTHNTTEFQVAQPPQGRPLTEEEKKRLKEVFADLAAPNKSDLNDAASLRIEALLLSFKPSARARAAHAEQAASLA